jgi:hypothetical protein
VSGVALTTKTVKLKGMNGLKNGVVVNSFDLPANDPAGGVHLTLQTTVTNVSEDVSDSTSKYSPAFSRPKLAWSLARSASTTSSDKRFWDRQRLLADLHSPHSVRSHLACELRCLTSAPATFKLPLVGRLIHQDSDSGLAAGTVHR